MPESSYIPDEDETLETLDPEEYDEVDSDWDGEDSNKPEPLGFGNPDEDDIYDDDDGDESDLD